MFNLFRIALVISLIIPIQSFARYGLRLGFVLDDMSKANVQRMQNLSNAFNYRFGTDLRIVVQKRRDLLLKLYQKGDVDFLLTRLPQVLSLEKVQQPFKLLLRSFKRSRSDMFILLMTNKDKKRKKDVPKVQFPIERYFLEFGQVIIDQEASMSPLFFPNISGHAKKLVMKNVIYKKEFFNTIISSIHNPLVVDICNFSVRRFGKIRSYRDRAAIEHSCNCKVYKMSDPIPELMVLVNPAFYNEHPLQTYHLMEFFLLITEDEKLRKTLNGLFGVDGFLTATNGVLKPFKYFLSKFKFMELAMMDL